MDPFALLQADHQRIRRLFRLIESGNDKCLDEQVLEQIRAGLVLHTRIEESIVYPECERYLQFRPLIARFYGQHDRFMALLAEVRGGQPEGISLLHKLIQQVEAHVREEDEELFPRARREIPTAVLEGIAAELEVVIARAGPAASEAGAALIIEEVGDG